MMGKRTNHWGRGVIPITVPAPTAEAAPAVRASQLDEFDRRLRRSIIIAFVGGSISHFFVTHLRPGGTQGSTVFADLMVLLGLLSALVIARLPWHRYGRELFALILLYSSFLIAGLIYSTGGAESPFELTFLLIAISAGLYHPTRLASLVAIACAVLGFLPFLYATPGRDFLTQQLVISGSVLAIFWFHRLIMPELLRRARAEEGLQDDLRETRRLRDELARANALLAQQARTDALTGLPNHGAIIAQTDAALAHAAHAGGPLSLLFFDLDHFKAINDTHGHQAGDRVLATVGRRAAAVLRPDDIIGRYGGEEFLVLLPGAGQQEAAQIAERLRVAMRARPFALPGGSDLTVTVSIGMATCAVGACSRQALLHAADLALYEAKHGGRDRVCYAPVHDLGDHETASAAD